MTKRKNNHINGAIIKKENLLESFKKASEIKRSVEGRFALISDLLNAKLNLVNLNYFGYKTIYAELDRIVTPGVIFYGKTEKKNTPILIISNNFSKMFEENPIILERSKLYTNPKVRRISSYDHGEIKLTPEEFYKLESGDYGEVSIIDYVRYSKKIKEKNIKEKDINYNNSNCMSLSLKEAMNNEILKVLIPNHRGRILKKLLEVTEETIMRESEIGKYKELVEEKKIDRYKFLKIIHLDSVLVSHGDPVSEIRDFTTYTGRFIGFNGNGPQGLTYKNEWSRFPTDLTTTVLPFNINFNRKSLSDDEFGFIIVKDERLLEKAVPVEYQSMCDLGTGGFLYGVYPKLIYEWIKEKDDEK